MKRPSMIRAKIFLLCAFSVWSVIFIATAAAESIDLTLRNSTNNKLLVAIDAWPPFRILEEDEYRGIDFELWTRLADELGLTLEFVRCPWVRCLKMMENGDVDAMSGLALREDRAVYMEYLPPAYYQCSTVFYVKKGQGHRIHRYRDLYQLNVGIVAGSAYFQPFDKDPNISKVSVSTEKQLIQMLGKERIPAIIGTDCQADYEIAQSPFKGFFEKAEYRPGNSVNLYFAISKKSKFREKREDFTRALESLLRTGAVEDIQQVYLH